MFKNLARYGVVTVSLMPLAQAVEQLPEASALAPAGYAVFYTGACAERVGLKVIHGARTDGDTLPGLIKRAEQSVQYVLARCPQATEIVADVRSNRSPTLATYFTMSRTDNWKPSGQIGSGELKSLLDSAGYRVFAGPRPIYSKAYWRLENSRFDAVYGNDLENRMVATHVERRGPDDYRVRGQLYDLGYSDLGKSCESSREGYSRWGSFTMTVSPGLSSLPVVIQWCAEHQQTAKTENTEFFDVPWNGSQAAKPAGTAQILATALASMPGLIDAADEAVAREPLIDREFYRVYATRPELCSHREFDVIYRVNHERRDSVFAGDYQQAVSNVVGTLAARRCGTSSWFTVNAYSVGDPERWDSIRFEFDDAATVAEEVPFRVARRRASARAEQYDQNLAAMRFGPCEGPFCELSGGRYLNAIYRGDLEIVRQIDSLHQQAVGRFLDERKSVLGDGALRQVFDAVFDTSQIQLLEQVTNKYMHAYGMWGDACLDAGAQKRSYEFTTPVVIETDEYGTTTSGGITFETTYTLNREFFPLRDKLATYKGAKRSDDPANLDIKGPIYRGIVELIEGGDCRSSEVKQFERQLRELASDVMREPGTLPPTDAVRPPQPERVVAAAFKPTSTATGQSVAWNAPVPLPAFTSKGAAAEGAPRPMNQQQRMTRMNEEMQAAQTRFENDLAAIQVRASKARRQGASQADLMQMMQQGQTEMMQLQQQFQEEIYRIQQKYQ